MNFSRKLLAISVIAAIAAGGGAVAQASDSRALSSPSTADAQSTSAAAPDATAAGDQEKEAPHKLQRVVVTGTRIPKADIATAQPLVTLDSQEIAATGQIGIGAILQQLAITSLNPLNRQSVNDGHPQAGGAFVNLRNLGAARTLVLVNGHRWATTRDGGVDLSSIPSAAIARIEILKDGASAIYGSDAIAGVVNIITKSHFDGLQANAYYGVNGEGDGINERYSVSMGKTGEKSSFFMSLSETKQGVVWARNRALTRYPMGPRHPKKGWSLDAPAGKFALLGPSGNPTSVYALNQLGADATNIANYHLYTGSPSDKYNANMLSMARLPIDAKTLFVHGNYDFTPNVSFVATAAYTQRLSSVKGAGMGLSSSSFPDQFSGHISSGSVFNPVASDIGFYTRLTGLRSVRRNTSDTKHIDAGLVGQFNIGIQNWRWDVNVDVNSSSYDIRRIGGLNLSHVQAAIGPSFVDAGGVAHCGSPGSVINGCIPWNVLGGSSSMTPELGNYLGVNATWRQFTDNKAYSADLSGGLFDIPFGGTVAVAFGVQRRELSIRTRLDPLVLSGVTSFSAQQPTQGGYGVNAAYGELSIPLLEGVPGAQRLAFDIARRYSHYSTFGGTTNSKYAFTWQPINDVLVRGSFSQAFRSPSLNDMFGGSSRFSVYMLDPCDAKYGAQIYGSAVHAACSASLATAAPGVSAATFRQLDGAGKPIATSSPIPPLLVDFSSNPNLGPETSNSRTLGFIYSPHFVPGLNIGVDWYKTEVWNAVTLPDPNLIMRFCFQGNKGSCTFTRDPTTGQLDSFAFGFMNLGKLLTEGYDVSVKYKVPQTSFGKFQVRLRASYLDKWGRQSAPGHPMRWQVGWSESGIANWRLRSNLSLNWQRGPVGATWTIRYFSGLREACEFSSECNQPNHVSPLTGLSPARRVGAIAFNDINVHVAFPWEGKLTVGVNNLFDRDPPITYSSLSNSGSPPVQGAYDLDRYMYVSYQQRF